MNKRKTNKNRTKRYQRIEFFAKRSFYEGIRINQPILPREILDICYCKKHKPFKSAKKYWKDRYVACDFSSGKDYSVTSYIRRQNGILTVEKVEVVHED